jgi:RNA polymerase sigma factor (sigma-70 family)
MPPVMPTDRPGGLGFPNHRGDRGSPSASVASAQPESALAQHTLLSPKEAYAQFSAFVERYTAALVRYARSGDTDFHLAEDFVQAAHLKLWAKWRRTGELITNLAYSCTIVRSVKIDYYRAVKNTFAVATDFSAEALEAENNDVKYVPKYTEAFRREVAKLTPQIRRVMELTFYDELDVQEIAARLQLSPRTVSNYRSIGKDRLVTAFRESTEE